VEVVAARRRRPLFGHGLRRSDELQHPLGHHGLQLNQVILLRNKRANRVKAALRIAIHHVRHLKSINLT
jgi:hypothetical protein